MHAVSAIDIEMHLLIEAIYLRYSYDFRNYSSVSQKRRLQYAVQQMKCGTISELQARVVARLPIPSWNCCST